MAGFRCAAALVLMIGVAGCTVSDQEPPALIGPSGFSQSVTVSASPDQLPRDGSSQSIITISVRNETGQGVSGQRLAVTSTGGTLSQTEVVTGNDGRATLTLTAPPPNTPTPSRIDLFVTPVGGNADVAVTRTASVTLVGQSNATAPSPSFTFTPTAPEIQQLVTFDATATTDEGAACTTTCTFQWNFGDGTTGSGSTVQHRFTSVGSFNVTLTVSDAFGSNASLSQSVTVADVDAPTVEEPVVSPDPAIADQQAVFTASASAATGHRIVRYSWDFGDGTTATSTEPTITKTYTVPGTYTVISTATDDLGRSGRNVITVTVANPVPNPPVARFTVSPAQPRVGEPATFDARTSTAGTRAVIVSYRWSFGDGTVVTTTTPTILHTYDEARTFPVTLTVTDNTGQTSTVGQSVTVVAP